jgi:hypothetical protein
MKKYTLDNDDTDFQKQYRELSEKYTLLQNEHDQLKRDHDQLKHDYSENTIIQSMNDMKTKYDRLVQTSVPTHKYNLLSNKYSRMLKYTSACSVILEHLSKLTRQALNIIYSTDGRSIVSKIDNELHMTRDLIEDSISLSNSDLNLT